MLKSLNGHVAVTPIEFDHDKGVNSKNTIKGFVVTDKLSKNLVKTEVVFGDDEVPTGSIVFIKADFYNIPEYKKVYQVEIDGTTFEFSLIPKNYIVLMRAP